MAFVSGMMGPYMSPMPIGASIAMILSLFVALTVLFRISFITRKDDQKQKMPKA
jgi:multidrug efflux pump subunit AcrB